MKMDAEENLVKALVASDQAGSKPWPRYVRVKIENCGSYTFNPWNRRVAKRLLAWLLQIPPLLLDNFAPGHLARWTKRGRRIRPYDDLAEKLVQLAREAALGMPLAEFQLYGEADHLCTVLEYLVGCPKIQSGRREIFLKPSGLFQKQAPALSLARFAVNHALFLPEPEL